MRPLFAATLALAAGLAAACRHDATTAEWPTRPVTVVVPFGSGSGVDLAARLLAPRLAERWRQPVVIDNRPGVDGIAGVQTFVAATNRHTLLFTPAGQVTLTPFLHDRLPFDPQRDVVPAAAVVVPSIGFSVTDAVEAASLAELAAVARRQPGRLLWTAAPGLPEVLFKAFMTLEKLDMTHVPYRDQSVGVQDLAAGRLHAGVFAVPTLMSQVKAGAVRLVAVTGTARIAAAPEVPTTAEAGYPLLSADSRWGIFGWRDIPGPLRDRIADDLRFALSDPGTADRLRAMGLEVAPGTAEEFSRDIQHQRDQLRDIVRLIGLGPTTSQGGR